METEQVSLSERFSRQVRAHLAYRRSPVAALAAAIDVSEATVYRRLNEGAGWPLDDAARAAEWFGYQTVSDMLTGGIPESAA